jgi:hypothetical protein
VQQLSEESMTVHITDDRGRREASYVIEQDFRDEDIMESLAGRIRPLHLSPVR